MIPTKLRNANASVITVTNTASTLFSLITTSGSGATTFLGTENAINLVIEDGDVRVLFDGNTPTASKGLLLRQGATYGFTAIDVNKVQLIRVGGSNVLVDVEIGTSTEEQDMVFGGGSGTVDGTGAANRVAFWTDANSLSSSANFQFDGTTITAGDATLLKLGTTNSFGLVNQSAFASPFGVISSNSTSRLMFFTTWANKDFDWVNSPGIAPNDPVFIFTGRDQTRNALGFISLDSNSRYFSIEGQEGDDVDGTTRNANGISIRISAPNAGTLGGNGGELLLVTGSALANNGNGGNIYVDLGTGVGTGAGGSIITVDPNTDMRFKLNGTGVFRVESNNDSSSALILDYNSGTGRALIDNTSVGGSLGLEMDTYMNGRFNEIQGADVGSANNMQLDVLGNSFEITGNTQINTIATERFQNGTVVTLLFSSNPVVAHNQAAGAGFATILLDAAANFNATAGDTLTLRLSEIGGTQAWREIGRAVI